MHAADKYFVPERRTTVLLKGEGGGRKARGEKRESQRPARLAAASTRREPENKPPAKRQKAC